MILRVCGFVICCFVVESLVPVHGDGHYQAADLWGGRTLCNVPGDYVKSAQREREREREMLSVWTRVPRVSPAIVRRWSDTLVRLLQVVLYTIGLLGLLVPSVVSGSCRVLPTPLPRLARFAAALTSRGTGNGVTGQSANSSFCLRDITDWMIEMYV